MVIDENEKNYFVQKNGQTFGLSKVEGEHLIGEAVEGFGYQNQKHENQFYNSDPEKSDRTLRVWYSHFFQKRSRGFVDIGLPDKDFARSLDELPTMTKITSGLKKGDRLMISLKVDAKDRIWGSLADEKSLNH